LVDLAVRVGVEPTGSENVLAYRISGRHELLPTLTDDVSCRLGEEALASEPAPSESRPELVGTRLPRSRRVLTELKVDDVVQIAFEDGLGWEQGVVTKVDTSWPQPYCVIFADDPSEYWIRLDTMVKLLDHRGRVVACTPDLIAGTGVDDGGLPEITAENFATLAPDQIRIALDHKTTAELHELLMEIHYPPKSTWNKEQMIRAFISHRGDELSPRRVCERRLAEFLSDFAREGECPMSAEYYQWMGLVDRNDQAQELVFPKERIYGGADRAFVFHLLTVLFVNARAVHLDLHGSAASGNPGPVKDYIKAFVESRRVRGQE
jgi:hypothetical protein